MSKKRTKSKPLRANASGAVEIVGDTALGKARLKLHDRGFPTATSAKKEGTREEIQAISHRVMGSRQSKRTTERSRQQRQPKRGRGSQKK